MKTAAEVKKAKGKKKIAVLSLYDAMFAIHADNVGIDLLLVGDSVSNVLLGFDSTKRIGMAEMQIFTKAVANAKPGCMVIGDMPYRSYTNKRTALENAKKFLKAGADAVKIEGNKYGIVMHLVKNKIPVMGHVGLLPQSAKKMRVHGKGEKEAKKIFDEALQLEKAGCFSIVLESMPAKLAKRITTALKIPTIGLGAGKYCDGQVLVAHDLLGINPHEFKPKFVKHFARLSPAIERAFGRFKKEVEQGKYPSRKYSYH